MLNVSELPVEPLRPSSTPPCHPVKNGHHASFLGLNLRSSGGLASAGGASAGLALVGWAGCASAGLVSAGGGSAGLSWAIARPAAPTRASTAAVNLRFMYLVPFCVWISRGP